MAYGGTTPPGPKVDISFEGILPYYSVLKDGTPVVLQRLLHDKAVAAKFSPLDRRSICVNFKTVRSVHELLNYEIQQGNSYPFEAPLGEEQLNQYFFGHDTFVLLRCCGYTDNSSDMKSCDALLLERNSPPLPLQLPDPNFVGCFYVKPNYPGRSAHLCNGGFLVAPAYRGSGAGFLLGERFRLIAQRLGYRGSVFNLVFHDNPASQRLWQRLCFRPVGVLPGAGRRPAEQSRKGETEGNGPSDSTEKYVDATVWHLDLSKPLPFIPLPWEAAYTTVVAELRQRKPPAAGEEDSFFCAKL